MHDLEAIETINIEQLATATDRLLLHRGQVPRHRPDTQPISPARTMIVRSHRRGFDATTVLVSSIATSVFCAFATVAMLV